MIPSTQASAPARNIPSSQASGESSVAVSDSSFYGRSLQTVQANPYMGQSGLPPYMGPPPPYAFGVSTSSQRQPVVVNLTSMAFQANSTGRCQTYSFQAPQVEGVNQMTLWPVSYHAEHYISARPITEYVSLVEGIGKLLGLPDGQNGELNLMIEKAVELKNIVEQLKEQISTNQSQWDTEKEALQIQQETEKKALEADIVSFKKAIEEIRKQLDNVALEKDELLEKYHLLERIMSGIYQSLIGTSMLGNKLEENSKALLESNSKKPIHTKMDFTRSSNLISVWPVGIDADDVDTFMDRSSVILRELNVEAERQKQAVARLAGSIESSSQSTTIGEDGVKLLSGGSIYDAGVYAVDSGTDPRTKIPPGDQRLKSDKREPSIHTTYIESTSEPTSMTRTKSGRVVKIRKNKHMMSAGHW